MSLTETVIDGTIQPDGTLVLDGPTKLPAGRVKVIVQSLPNLPESDPFWQRMQAMWAIPNACGDVGDGGANTLTEVHKMREEWADHQQAIERLQDECRGTRTPPEEPKP